MYCVFWLPLVRTKPTLFVSEVSVSAIDCRSLQLLIWPSQCRPCEIEFPRFSHFDYRKASDYRNACDDSWFHSSAYRFFFVTSAIRMYSLYHIQPDISEWRARLQICLHSVNLSWVCLLKTKISLFRYLTAANLVCLPPIAKQPRTNWLMTKDTGP